MRLPSKIFVIAVCLVGCGGPSDSAPGPLSAHIEKKHIIQVEESQQTASDNAEKEWIRAQRQEGKAKADLDDMGTKIQAARNDRAKAKLEVDTAVLQKKSADASSDTNKVNVAQKDLRTAELALKAADARIRYYETYRGWLRTHWRHTQEHMYWEEAKFELAKADVAKKNNIAPKGVTYESFPKQQTDRGRRAASAKAKSDGGKAKAASAREDWLKAQQTADQASGKPSAYPDPMGAAAPTTASP